MHLLHARVHLHAPADHFLEIDVPDDPLEFGRFHLRLIPNFELSLGDCLRVVPVLFEAGCTAFF